MKGRRLLVLGLIGVVSIGAGLLMREGAVARLTGLEGLELKTLEYRQRLTRESFRVGERESEVVLVLFDQQSVEDWPYLSPFPRGHLADVIEALSAAGARTIGVDVYLEELFPELNRMDGGDDRLMAAIEDAGNVILVAPTVETEDGDKALKRPHEAFAGPAADVGAADLPTPFETVQDGLLAVRTGDGLEPSFALATWAHATGRDVDALLAEARETGRLPIEGMPRKVARLPESWSDGGASADFAFPFTLRFYGPPSDPGSERDDEGTFKAFASSFVPAVAPFAPENFRDKIVLLGTGFHDSDKFRTPFYDYAKPDAPGAEGEGGAAGEEDAAGATRGDQDQEEDIYGWMYGVEIHANAIQNLLDGDYVRKLGGAGTLGVLGLAALAVSAVVFWKGAVWGGIAATLAALVLVIGAFSTFAGQLILPFFSPELGTSLLWVPLVPAAVAILVSYLGTTAYVSIVEGKEKRFIRSAFGKYVPPAVVAEIAESPDALKLGGQKRPLSIFFSDLAGFTDLSESMDAQDLLALLNEYLTEMTDIVMAEGGTLDKYIGDAIMAFWNAPIAQEDHADRALRCAIRTQRKMDELNARWSEEGKGSEFVVRIGVNSGEVVVGNVGGEERFDYSAIGDAVNLAARLEPANKTYDTLVMASEYTIKEATLEDYRLRELDLIAVKGKTEPVTVYEVLGFRDEVFSDDFEECLTHFRAGMDAYRRRDWDLAREYFQAAVDADPGDGPSKVYLERTQENIADPPPADWDFVVRRTTK